MISRTLQLISKPGPWMGDLVGSAAGSSVFTRGFRLIAIDEVGSNTEAALRTVSRSGKSLSGIGAALFLLAFVTSEALATVVALRR
jgi:hypothetical protein